MALQQSKKIVFDTVVYVFVWTMSWPFEFLRDTESYQKWHICSIYMYPLWE